MIQSIEVHFSKIGEKKSQLLLVIDFTKNFLNQTTPNSYT